MSRDRRASGTYGLHFLADCAIAIVLILRLVCIDAPYRRIGEGPVSTSSDLRPSIFDRVMAPQNFWVHESFFISMRSRTASAEAVSLEVCDVATKNSKVMRLSTSAKTGGIHPSSSHATPNSGLIPIK